MATYSPESLNIQAPGGGFEQGGWYSGRQYWGGTLSDPGVIHPASDQQGSGQAVSAEVNRQSDEAQGHAPGTIENYLTQQRQQQQQLAPQPAPQQAPQPAPQPVGPYQSEQDSELVGLGDNVSSSTINLPEIYKSLTQSSGISELEQQYSEMEKAFIEAKGKSNNNPFLSEASRVGREAKLQKLFDERTANIRGEIATKKADIETQLNLQMKQFDINSQQTKMAWEQFNTLLGMGALNNASGEDIANITRSTGISSAMIRDAIAEANKPEPAKTTIVQSEDDNGVVTVSVINSETGSVISQESLGAIGTKTKVTGGTDDPKPGSSTYVAENKGLVSQYLSQNTNDYGHVDPGAWRNALQAWLDDTLGTTSEFIKNYKHLTDPNRGDFKQRSGYGFDPYEYK